ncbi:discoidin domain-containing protein [Pedobacter sp. AW31-3R]|uniref:discoidin domain-containing protein n=1 Tax=Pedobacter sp. AW31-3R TaxID=3445781 RepID=UPI003F9FA2DE
MKYSIQLFLSVAILGLLSTCSNFNKNSDNKGLSHDDQNRLDLLTQRINKDFLLKNDTILRSSQFVLEAIRYKSYMVSSKQSQSLDFINKYISNDSLLISKIDSLNQNAIPSSKDILDLHEINAKEIEEDILFAYKNLQKTKWKKRISFDTYCNYILPYKLNNTFPDPSWRKFFLNTYMQSTDSSIYKLNLEEAVATVHHWIYKKKKDFKILPWLGLHNLPPIVSYQINIGSCEDLTVLGTAIFRSLSIPASIDFTPRYLNKNAGHEWNAIILENSTFIPFDITSAVLYRHKLPDDLLSKVYRKTFTYNKNSHFAIAGFQEHLPGWLNDPYITDVTHLYSETSDITIEQEKHEISKNNIAYLSVFDAGNWIPVAWALQGQRKAKFENVARGGVYLPIIFSNSKFIAIDDPLILDNKGMSSKLKANLNSLETVEIKRKYPLNKMKEIFLQRMVGGSFEGSNTADFAKSTKLHEIKTTPGEHYEKVFLKNTDKFRFIRYLSPVSSYGNIAEFKCYNQSSDRVKGKAIGSEGSLDPYTGKEAALDNNPHTFFYSNEPDSNWVGMDFGTSQNISMIEFLPRNDMNSIQIGQQYELFFWNNEWKSLGKKTASSNTLIYKNVPKNSLLWIKCYDEGVEERIFTFKGGKQIWW